MIMVDAMKDPGKKTKDMVKALKNFQMGIPIQASMKMEKFQEKVYIHGPMVIYMKGNGWMG